MTPETKFRELESRAIARLMRPLDAQEFVEMIHASVIILIWRYPAFGPYQSWALIKETVKEPRWLVRRTTWERSIDYDRRLIHLSRRHS